MPDAGGSRTELPPQALPESGELRGAEPGPGGSAAAAPEGPRPPVASAQGAEPMPSTSTPGSEHPAEAPSTGAAGASQAPTSAHETVGPSPASVVPESPPGGPLETVPPTAGEVPGVRPGSELEVDNGSHGGQSLDEQVHDGDVSSGELLDASELDSARENPTRVIDALAAGRIWGLRDTELYRRLLGLETPWKVGRVELSATDGLVDVWVPIRPGPGSPARIAMPCCRSMTTRLSGRGGTWTRVRFRLSCMPVRRGWTVPNTG